MDIVFICTCGYFVESNNPQQKGDDYHFLLCWPPAAATERDSVEGARLLCNGSSIRILSLNSAAAVATCVTSCECVKRHGKNSMQNTLLHFSYELQ